MLDSSRFCSLIFLAFLLVVLITSPHRSAQAANVHLVWTDTNGIGTTGSSTIEALPGETLTLTLRISLSPGESLSAYSASIRWDSDLADELDLISVSELSVVDSSNPLGVMDPLDPGPDGTQESIKDLQIGEVLSCEAAAFGPGITTPGTYDLCEIRLIATEELIDGNPNLASGAFNPPFDGFIDDDNLGFTPSYTGANVDRGRLIPTPALPIGGVVLPIVFLMTGLRLQSRNG